MKLNTYVLPAQNSAPSRLHQGPNINPGTLKLLEDKAGSMSQRLSTGRKLLNKISAVQK